MKRYYYALPLLLAFSNTQGSSSYSNSSYGYKDSSGGGSQSRCEVKQEVKQQETTVQKQSLEYAREYFKTFDTPSQHCVGHVVHNLKIATDPHDYTINLGLFTALSIIKGAQQNPTLLKAAQIDTQLQQKQLENIKINLAKTFESNVEQNSGIAQKISNFFVSLAESFQKSKEQAREINRSLDRHAIGIPGLKHIKEFVSKFSNLSSEGKKTVGWLVLNGNTTQALKVVAHGDKGIYVYDRTRQNNIVGSNPKCKVHTNDTPNLFLSSDMKTFYTFDCPKGQFKSAVLSFINTKCDFSIEDTMICPSYESPFKTDNKMNNYNISVIELKSRCCKSVDLPGTLPFDSNYAQNEFAVGQKYLKDLDLSNCSLDAINHLYAQAILVGQDVFNINNIPVECVQKIAQRYGTTFTLPKSTTWTQEDIVNEINAARTYLSSHVLFMNEMPSSYTVNQLQYAEALGVMNALVGNSLQQPKEQAIEHITKELVVMPEKQRLEKIFNDLDLDYFAEKSKIIEHLAQKELCFLGIVIAVDNAPGLPQITKRSV